MTDNTTYANNDNHNGSDNGNDPPHDDGGGMTDSEASLMLTMFETEIIEGYRPPGIPHFNNINIVNQRISDYSSSNDDYCGDVGGGDGDGDGDCNFANDDTFADSADAAADQRRLNRPQEEVQWVRKPNDGSVLLDQHGFPVSMGRLLATKPLKDELSSRKGPGGKNLLYMAGSSVSRSLNYIFGQDGWNLEIKNVQQVGKNFNNTKRKFEIVYTAHVRLVHRLSGTYREEVGCSEASDKSYATAVGNAIKGSITDALKRSARHFGDKLGGAIQNNGNLTKNNAPTTLQDALDMYDIERANTKFGCLDDPNKKAEKQQTSADASNEINKKQEMNDLDPGYGTPSGSTKSKQPLSDNILPQQGRQTEQHGGQTPAFPSDILATGNATKQQQQPQQNLQNRSYQGPGRANQISPFPSKTSASGHLNTTTPVKEAEPILTYHDSQFWSPTFMSPSHDPSSMQETKHQKGLVVTPSTSLSSSDQALASRPQNPRSNLQILDPVSNQRKCCATGIKRPEVPSHNITNSSNTYHQSSSHRPHKTVRYSDSL